MAVGSYFIDYYPDHSGAPEEAAHVAVGIAKHTGNPVQVWAGHPTEEDPEPGTFTVYGDSSPDLIAGLIAALNDTYA